LFVTGCFANGFLKAFDGFQVVIKNVGLGIQNDVELIGVALKIGCEHFDGGIRATIANGPDGSGPDIGTSILQIISCHRCDDAVSQSHFGHGFGDSWWFSQVQLGRFPGIYGAEGAGPGANVAKDHHRSRSP